MSEQNPYQYPQENDDLSLCCKNISADKRKIGFYITLGIGVILYITAIINFFGSVFGSDISYMYAIFAALITLLCPLWMRSFSQVLSGLNEPSRKLTFLILIVSFIGLLVFRAFDVSSLSLICILALILSGIWLSLSYYQNGQESLLDFLKRCFGRNKNDMNNSLNNNDGNNNV